MLSIVIITLNEEQYLPKLLESIKKQDFKDYEIIVADAGSKDKTLEIAKQYGCRIVRGGLPARGRNEGAKIAKGDMILFTDADNIMPDQFLSKNIEEFKKRKLSVASVLVKPIGGRKITAWIFYVFYNIPIIIMERFLAHTAIAIFMRKDLFQKINGFDENVVLAEDHDMGRRAAEFGKFGVLRSKKILTSERRFKQDGWFSTYMKYIYTELHMIIKGPVKDRTVVKYNFDHYSKKDK